MEKLKSPKVYVPLIVAVLGMAAMMMPEVGNVMREVCASMAQK